MQDSLKHSQNCEIGGNTVIVVEHDEEIIRNSDWMLDLGPGAGVHGGNVVFQGRVDQILNGHKSVTGDYLKDKSLIKLKRKKAPRQRKTNSQRCTGKQSVKNITVEFPLGKFITITGVSRFRKIQSLVNETHTKGT